MGIDVLNKSVYFNPDHHKLVITNPDKLPKTTIIKGLKVDSIFRRVKSKGEAGDGNPLIYALKGKKGYSITVREILKFKPSFEQVLDVIINGQQYDYVIGMPSASNVTQFLSRRIARKCNAKLVGNFFEKQTIGDALRSIDVDSVPEKYKRDVKQQLRRYKYVQASDEISLKDVNVKVRQFFPPIKLNPTQSIFPSEDKSIVIVDDLLATGTTLLTASNLLKQEGYSCAKVVCLLSNLDR